MLDFYRRVWQAFFIGSPALAGIAWLFRESPKAFISLLVLATICFIIALIGLYLDYLDARKKAKQERIDADREELYQSVRRLHPEYTEQQIKWFIDGK